MVIIPVAHLIVFVDLRRDQQDLMLRSGVVAASRRMGTERHGPGRRKRASSP
jgi:hypothetical protein